MKPAQVRMARAALGWSLQELADRAGVHRNTVNNFERGHYGLSADNLEKVRRTLEAAGVDFIAENGGGPGVRLARPEGDA